MPGAWLLAVVVFVLFAPGVFALGPLAGLLLAARPVSRREWFWIGAGVASAAVWAIVPGGLATQFFRSFGLILTGVFTLFIALSPSRPQRQAIFAVAATMLGIALWLGVFRLDLRDVEADLARTLAAQALMAAAILGSAVNDARLLFETVAGQARDFATLLPSAIILVSFGGLALAWRGFHYLSDRAWGAPPRPFAQFTFNDHAIWLLVVSLGLSFVPLDAMDLVSDVVGNLLMVMLVLYAVRGAAVFGSALTRISGLGLTLLIVLTVVMWGFVLAGLMLLGVADTWLDFRRRLAASATGGK